MTRALSQSAHLHWFTCVSEPYVTATIPCGARSVCECGLVSSTVVAQGHTLDSYVRFRRRVYAIVEYSSDVKMGL